jgi:hypothetical protein
LVAQDLQYVFTEYYGRIKRDASARHARYRAAEADYLESLQTAVAPLAIDEELAALESSTNPVHAHASRDFSWNTTRGDK